uniref:Uncharacterized protein n=2 Tax=Oryzinae TaxID=1648021 RepID=A0A0D9VVB0_9ORYZ
MVCNSFQQHSEPSHTRPVGAPAHPQAGPGRQSGKATGCLYCRRLHIRAVRRGDRTVTQSLRARRVAYTNGYKGAPYAPTNGSGAEASENPQIPLAAAAAFLRRQPPARPRRFALSPINMSRGGSAGGGQSSLGYLFGGNEAPKPAAPKPAAAPAPAAPAPPPAAAPAEKASPAKADGSSQIPAGIQGSRSNNNYHRADGQNTGNFLTDRPSTKVHAAPGGGSSLGYLFGGN